MSMKISQGMLYNQSEQWGKGWIFIHNRDNIKTSPEENNAN